MRGLCAFGIMAVFAVTAAAEDNPAAPVATPVPGVTAPAAGPAATPGSSTATPAPAAVAPAEVVKPAKGVLKDGTNIEFDPDGSVVILNADGSRTPAPDGILTLKDGTTFNVRGGKKTDD